ncbi:MAG: YebC/PmpR family DNA-binding transcriptional regulator [Acidimicrobiia bacterium]
MAGHSKWANIKHRKGRQDAIRGKAFAKLAKVIESAARHGGGDPTMNVTLAGAIAKAKAASMPNDNIERAVKRGTGEAGEGAVYEEIWYEGYGPGGVALYIHVLTDNRNRAASDVRATITRNGGNLGEPGTVAYLFDQKGHLAVAGDEDSVMLAAIEAGAEDVRGSDGSFEVVTAPSDLVAVQQALASAGLQIESAEVTQLPRTTIPVEAATASKLLRLVDALEDLDDVQDVYANFDVSEAVMEELANA